MTTDRKGLADLMRSISRKDWLTPELEAYFAGRIGEQWWAPSPKMHPSGAVGDCPRDIELSLLGHKTPVEGRLSRIFDVGHAMHDRWARYFEEMKCLVASEVPIETVDGELMIKGKLDNVIKAPLDTQPELYVVELKSMADGPYRKLPEPQDAKDNLYALARLHPKYVGQWLCYVKAFDEAQQAKGERRVENGLIIFENKNTQDYKVFLLTYDHELWLRLTENARTAQQAFLTNHLVDPPYMRFSAPCQKCARKELCYKLQDGDGKSWQTVIARLAAGLKRYTRELEDRSRARKADE